jgi:hypothetical protein
VKHISQVAYLQAVGVFYSHGPFKRFCRGSERSSAFLD